ncbi:hypothetical protein M3Y99_01996600 [Aphelenchoides fujianensis]|nr:hypothetical protein M3Y99_01996600 [Aphelenchoides fujianensis]
MFAQSSSILRLVLLVAAVECGLAFYALPRSFQQYMEERRALLRPLAPLPEVPFQSFVIDEPIPPLPTPLPLRAAPAEVPRRPVRQFSDQTRQFKRLRPCYYSPIQCLIKRSGPPAAASAELFEGPKEGAN